MSYIHLHARRTGRTTRMLEEAMCAIQQGSAVYILSVDETSAHHIKQLYEKAYKAGRFILCSVPKFETLRSIGQENIDWKNQNLHRAHPNCKLFIDHSVYEYLYSDIINGYHEYDAQIAVNAKWANEKLRR